MSESGECEFTQSSSADGRVITDLIRTLTVAERCYSQGNGPIRRILPDRRVTVVHELVAVVFELLSKVIQHWPSFMARRTAQSVFSCEGWKRVRRTGEG